MTQPDLSDLSDLSDLKILRLRKSITDTILSTLAWFGRVLQTLSPVRQRETARNAKPECTTRNAETDCPNTRNATPDGRKARHDASLRGRQTEGLSANILTNELPRTHCHCMGPDKLPSQSVSKTTLTESVDRTSDSPVPLNAKPGGPPKNSQIRRVWFQDTSK